MGKYIFGAVLCVFIIVEIAMFVDFRKFMKQHEQDLVSEHRTAILTRMSLIVIGIVVIGVMGVLMQFMN